MMCPLPLTAGPNGRSVSDLQTMLRVISFRHPWMPRLVPDGIFGEQTLEAVMLFQRELFPPVTGVVDNAVWDAIVDVYQHCCSALSPPLPCCCYPSRDYTISPGESCAHLGLIQAMFMALAHILVGLQETADFGTMDDATVQNIRWIQRQNQAEETGVIDHSVWDTLARLYAVFVTYAQTASLSRPELFSSNP